MSDSEWDSHDDDDDNAAVAVAAARSLPRRAGAIKTEDDAVSVAESFATAVSRAPTGASRPPAPRPARTAPLPAASAATNLAVSAVTPAAAPLHANDEAAKAIARIYGRLAPELAAQRLSMDIASVDVILAMGGDAEVRLRSVMDRLVAVRLVATAQWVPAARQQSERIVAAIMDAGPGVASTRAVAAASQSVADRADTPTSRGLVPDASGNDHSVAAADDHHDDDDRGSISYKSEAFDDDESMPESDWDLREAAALRHEAEVRAFAPPPDPIFYLGNTCISSADYACPRQLRKTALSHAEPRPLNLVVRIVENKPSKKNGTSQYRLMKVDLGDGVMGLLANVGSDLYNIDKKNNAFPIDAIVILEDVRGVFRGRALALDFWPFSRISRCDDEWRRLGNQGS